KHSHAFFIFNHHDGLLALLKAHELLLETQNTSYIMTQKHDGYSPGIGRPKVALPEDETYGWKHPDELPYPEEADWPDNKIVQHLFRHAITLPSKPSPGTFHVFSTDGTTITLPTRYRIPILWLEMYKWKSLFLVLNSNSASEWKKYKLRVLYLSMITASFIEQAQHTASTVAKGMSRTWRCAMFDRVLRRVRDGHLDQEPISIKEYWDEFGGLAYKEDDVLYGDLRKIFGKGSKVTAPWTLDDKQLAEGLTIAQSTEGLVQQGRKWVWPSDTDSPVYWARHSTVTPSAVAISKLSATSDDIGASSALPRHASEPNLRHSTNSDLFSETSSRPLSPEKDIQTEQDAQTALEKQLELQRHSPIPTSISTPSKRAILTKKGAGSHEMLSQEPGTSSAIILPTIPTLTSVEQSSSNQSPVAILPASTPLTESNERARVIEDPTSRTMAGPSSYSESSNVTNVFEPVILQVRAPGSFSHDANASVQRDTPVGFHPEATSSSQLAVPNQQRYPSFNSIPAVASVPVTQNGSSSGTPNAMSGATWNGISTATSNSRIATFGPSHPSFGHDNTSLDTPSSISTISSFARINGAGSSSPTSHLGSTRPLTTFPPNATFSPSPDPATEASVEATRQLRQATQEHQAATLALQKARDKLRDDELQVAHERNLTLEERKISIAERLVARQLQQETEARDRELTEREELVKKREGLLKEGIESLRKQEKSSNTRLRHSQEIETRAAEREERAKEEERAGKERIKAQEARALERIELGREELKQQERLLLEREERVKKRETRVGEREDAVRIQEGRNSDWEALNRKQENRLDEREREQHDLLRRKEARLEERAREVEESARKQEERLEARIREQEEDARQQRLILSQIRANYETAQTENHVLKRRLSMNSFHDSSFPPTSRIRLEETDKGPSPLATSATTIFGPDDDASSMEMSPTDTGPHRHQPIVVRDSFRHSHSVPLSSSSNGVMTHRSSGSIDFIEDEYNRSAAGSSTNATAASSKDPPSRPPSQTISWTRRKFQKFADGE
ncbi:hypothetical protein C8J56DRAFT_400589, partial [Mycena floridula]